MSDSLLTRPEWFVLGPLIGLTVVAMVGLINQRLGALGGYSNILERATGRTPALGWKAWFIGGVLAGSLLWRLLAGDSTVGEGYGWLTRTFDSDLLVAGMLVLGGVLIGFGAKTAGGCTSGNGLGGCSAGSPASFTATATFMATAIGASFLISAVT